MKNFFDIFNVE